MKKVAVIGYGYVGQAIHGYFNNHFEVLFYDPEKEASASFEAINQADLAVVCVPTPMKEDGTCDVSIVEETFKWLKVPLVLIKSTVLPGTTKRLQELYPEKNIVFSPEYIGEGKYEIPQGKGYPDPTDMKKHDFFIFGGKKAGVEKVVEFFKKVSGPDPRYMKTDSTTAEVCKYAENAFLATKVTFCNELYEICKAMGVDYDEMREMWLMDGRIGRSHTAVFKNSRGFGGKCLPKDVNAIVKATERAGYSPTLLKAVLSTNDAICAKGEKGEDAR